MQVQAAILCDAASDYNGKLSLLGAFETLFAQKFPVVHPQCSLALRLLFTAEDEGDHKMSIRMLNADGHQLHPPIEPRFTVKLGDVSFITRNMVLNLQGLGFPQAGEYALQVSCDDEVIAEIPLRVVEVAAPAAAAASGGEPGGPIQD